EADTGEGLLFPVGGLLLSRARAGAEHHGQTDFVGRTIEVARRRAIAHEVLDAPEVEKRFPQLRLVGDELGYYEPGAGYLRPERCVAVQLDRAHALGAMARTDETVVRIVPGPSAVEVVSDVGGYTAAPVVVPAGPWLSALLGC